MARAADTNLYDQHILYLGKDFPIEKFAYGFGGHGEETVVYRNANALLAFSHAERSAKFDFIAEAVFRDQRFQLFHHLARAFDVA